MRILVVDDDYVSRVKLKALLSPYGDVDAAPDGDIGLKMVESAILDRIPYDLVTVDIDMPGTRGPQVVQQILESDREKVTKILTITHIREVREISDSLWEGADLCLGKPITSESLRDALGKIGLI